MTSALSHNRTPAVGGHKVRAGHWAGIPRCSITMPAHQKDKRWRVILLRQAGHTQAEIRRRTGYSKEFVGRWYHRDSGDDASRTGRPTKVTPAIVRSIRVAMKGKRNNSPRKIGRRLGLSKDTVRRAAKQRGLKPYRRPCKPKLTAKHRKRRLACCKKLAKSRLAAHVVLGREEIHVGQCWQ